MIITVTLNPALDKTVEIPDFEVGTVNRVSSVRLDAGGKGINVSKVVQGLGGESKAVGVLGGVSGRFIQDYLDHTGIANDFLSIAGETRTNLKVVDGSRKTNTDINEPGPELTIEELDQLEKKVFNCFQRDSVVVFSGSVPANVEKDLYGRWISAAKAAGAKTILDADGDLLKQGIAGGPFLVKPNIHELERFFDTRLGDIEAVERHARSLITDYDIEWVVVSLGGEGAVFLNRTASILAHGRPVEVKSTVGAGDAMVAALAFCIDRGYSLEESFRLAVAAGSANVTTTGTQPAPLSLIKAFESQVTYEHLIR